MPRPLRTLVAIAAVVAVAAAQCTWNAYDLSSFMGVTFEVDDGLGTTWSLAVCSYLDGGGCTDSNLGVCSFPITGFSQAYGAAVLELSDSNVKEVSAGTITITYGFLSTVLGARRACASAAGAAPAP